MLPGVKIKYENGALGQVEAMADGCLGFLAIGAASTANFETGKAYVVKKSADLEKLGVTAENNPLLYRNVKDFYAEAGDGAELWIMGFEDTKSYADVLDYEKVDGARALILATNGKLRMLAAFREPVQESSPVMEGGLYKAVWEGVAKAQLLGKWATEERYAPLFTLIEGYGYNDDPTDLKELTTMGYDRVGIVIGDTLPDSPNACMGIVAGRFAVSDVQRKISRVKSGALTPLEVYVGSEPAEEADVETVHEKGYVTFRSFVGKTGYFIADDNLATSVEDDYRSISNRRVIDKAYRIAYNTAIETVNDEVPIASDGTLSPAWCAALEGDIEQAIISNMTVNGNLGNDPGDPNDTGVSCSIPYDQNILSNSTLEISLRVKPNGYAKYINVSLGFKTE